MKKDYFEIEGLSGKRGLFGEVKVSGAKNAVLKIMAASLLFEDNLLIENAPEVEDSKRMAEIIEDMGGTVEMVSEGKMKINTSRIEKPEIKKEIGGKMRASIVLSGPILARFGEAHFPHPGGCVIGERPIGIFLNAFRGMGAEAKRDDEGTYHLKAEKGLRGKTMFFNKQSVTATETILMTAILSKGKTVIKNAALEPEIESLAKFLKECGAKIKGIGTTTLEIKGGGKLRAEDRVYKVIPDRIEAGSYILLGAVASNNMLIKNCEPSHLDSLLSTLRFMGLKMEEGQNYIKILDNSKTEFKAVEIKTHEYPGFPTDLQAPMTVLLTQAESESIVTETIFENRFGYVADLNKMGADIEIWHPQKISVHGETPLSGKTLFGPDLRAGLAMIMAAAIASGGSIVENAYYIDRGYEKVEEKLKNLGLNIKRKQIK